MRLLFVLGSGIALAAQDEGEGQGAASPAAEGKSLLGRTADPETLALPDGRLETRIYPDPVNYRDEEGNWCLIGERLKRALGRPAASKEFYARLDRARSLKAIEYHLSTLVKARVLEIVFGPEFHFSPTESGTKGSTRERAVSACGLKAHRVRRTWQGINHTKGRHR